jgi:DNA-binding beta-propeller fold protein YncE
MVAVMRHPILWATFALSLISPRADAQRDSAVPAPAGTRAPAGAQPAYRLLAGAESDDHVALIEFRPCAAQATACGARVVREYLVGPTPFDIEGPHGVVAAPDGKAFYVSIAHGKPNGLLEKYDLESGALLGVTELGMFPATIDVSPADLVYVINFNFHDPEMSPSSLSIVDGSSMMEVARPTTCQMPHGSRLDPSATRHYSACMMNDLLVEVDTRTFEVARVFRLTKGREGAVPATALPAAPSASHAGHRAGHDELEMVNDCSPTWAQPTADGEKVLVACNRSNEVVEIDVQAWRVSRRWDTPKAPYNMAVTPDGNTLVITQKGLGTTSIWRLSDATLLAEIPGTRKVASGVAVSADSRYAFVTLEGIAGDPGTVDIIDLAAREKVATVDIGKQAGGIAVLP